MAMNYPMTRRVVFRQGDCARVTTPRFVSRVGYPKSVSDYLSVVRGQHGVALDALFREVLGNTHMDPSYLLGGPSEPTRWRKNVEWELANALAHKDGFGGKERSIHWIEAPALVNAHVRIRNLRNAYTGTYYPPSGGGEDFEPGGLTHMKCHRLATVSLIDDEVDLPEVLHRELVIPVYHLEQLSEATR